MNALKITKKLPLKEYLKVSKEKSILYQTFAPNLNLKNMKYCYQNNKNADKMKEMSDFFKNEFYKDDVEDEIEDEL